MPFSIIKTPAGQVAVIPAIAQQLIGLGLVRQTAAGLEGDSKDAIERAIEDGGLGVCDFCTAQGVTAVFEIDDFDMLDGHRSTKGWAACAECQPLVRAEDRVAILERSIAGSSDPTNPMVAEALKQLHARFWAARGRKASKDATFAGTIAAVRDHILKAPGGWTQARLAAIAKRLRVSHDDIQRLALMTDDEFLAYCKHASNHPDDLTRALQKVAAQMDELQLQAERDRLAADSFNSPFMDPKRPWLAAVESQFAALRVGASILDAGPYRFPSLYRICAIDMKPLRTAESYAWGPDPLAACMMASQTIPADIPLTIDMLPGSSGWWHFAAPIDIKTIDDQLGVMAILWFWFHDAVEISGAKRPALVVSLYTWSKAHKAPVASGVFRWMVGEDINAMLQRATLEYTTDADMGKIGRDEFLVNIGKTVRFMAAGFSWLQQTILTTDAGHIERHRRKGLQREHKLDAQPADIRIVQLRRMGRAEGATEPSEPGEPVAWSCRWVVRGHWRKYHYRDGSLRSKFILPFIKGPADKPLRMAKQTVFAVSR